MAKPRKVEERRNIPQSDAPRSGSASKSAANQNGNAEVRYMDDATFRKSAEKVFKVHHELLRKLAQ